MGDGGSAVSDGGAGSSAITEPILAKALTNMSLGASITARPRDVNTGMDDAAVVEGYKVLNVNKGALLSNEEVHSRKNSGRITTEVVESRTCKIVKEIGDTGGDTTEEGVLAAGNKTEEFVSGQGEDAILSQEVESLGGTEVVVSGQPLNGDGNSREYAVKDGVQIGNPSEEVDNNAGTGTRLKERSLRQWKRIIRSPQIVSKAEHTLLEVGGK